MGWIGALTFGVSQDDDFNGDARPVGARICRWVMVATSVNF